MHKKTVLRKRIHPHGLWNNALLWYLQNLLEFRYWTQCKQIWTSVSLFSTTPVDVFNSCSTHYVPRLHLALEWDDFWGNIFPKYSNILPFLFIFFASTCCITPNFIRVLREHRMLEVPAWASFPIHLNFYRLKQQPLLNSISSVS